ncbi:MAG: hypothetical protein IT384_22740 [Deltaproteobacteria bacterium]|nr:hypothetical protein [Deltaproteobacteria bacterium]
MSAVPALRASIASLGDPFAPSAPANRGMITAGELEVFRELDLVLSPEALGPTSRSTLLPSLQSGDDLRLPPPPVQASEGYALYSALGRAVQRFEASRPASLHAPEGALLAEARMMMVLAGVLGLERDIREQMGRTTRI